MPTSLNKLDFNLSHELYNHLDPKSLGALAQTCRSHYTFRHLHEGHTLKDDLELIGHPLSQRWGYGPTSSLTTTETIARARCVAARLSQWSELYFYINTPYKKKVLLHDPMLFTPPLLPKSTTLEQITKTLFNFDSLPSRRGLKTCDQLRRQLLTSSSEVTSDHIFEIILKLPKAGRLPINLFPAHLRTGQLKEWLENLSSPERIAEWIRQDPLAFSRIDSALWNDKTLQKLAVDTAARDPIDLIFLLDFFKNYAPNYSIVQIVCESMDIPNPVVRNLLADIIIYIISPAYPTQWTGFIESLNGLRDELQRKDIKKYPIIPEVMSKLSKLFADKCDIPEYPDIDYQDLTNDYRKAREAVLQCPYLYHLLPKDFRDSYKMILAAVSSPAFRMEQWEYLPEKKNTLQIAKILFKHPSIRSLPHYGTLFRHLMDCLKKPGFAKELISEMEHKQPILNENIRYVKEEIDPHYHSFQRRLGRIVNALTDFSY